MMENELRDKTVKRNSSMSSLVGFIRGALIVLIGVFIIFADKFGFTMENVGINFRYFFGGISIVYGGWRIYRSFKKDAF